MKSSGEPTDPAAKRSYDICAAGFRSLLDAVDANDVAGTEARRSSADSVDAQRRYLDVAFLGPFFRRLKEGKLTLSNAQLLNATLRYMESRMGEPMNPLHKTYLKLLAWENFIEIPAPLILAGNCLQALRLPATFGFDFFRNQKGRGGLFSAPAKLKFVRKLADEVEADHPGIVTSAVTDMLKELDTIFATWLRHAVAHCYYRIDLGQRKVFAPNKGKDKSMTFEEVWDLYQKAYGYLKGFQRAVDQFAFESSDYVYMPNWGPNY